MGIIAVIVMMAVIMMAFMLVFRRSWTARFVMIGLVLSMLIISLGRVFFALDYNLTIFDFFAVGVGFWIAYRVFPKSAETQLRLARSICRKGIAAAKDGRHEDALKIFTEGLKDAIGKEPKATLLLNIAVCRLHLGDNVASVQALDEAIRIYPRYLRTIRKHRDFVPLHNYEPFRNLFTNPSHNRKPERISVVSSMTAGNAQINDSTDVQEPTPTSDGLPPLINEVARTSHSESKSASSQ
jgi:tetratricopeptide (TPR) repeat protein